MKECDAGAFTAVFNGYNRLHPYVVTTVCFLGLLLNCLCILIFSRRSMRGSTTNRVLLVMAVADSVTLVSTAMSEIFQINVCKEPCPNTTAAGAAFLLVTNGVRIGAHTAAMLFTMLLALLRVVILYGARRGNRVHVTHPMLNGFIGTGLLIGLAMMVPNLLTQEVKQNANGFWWFYDRPQFKALAVAYFFIYGVFVQGVACIVLSLLTVVILVLMHQARIHHLCMEKKLGEHSSLSTKMRLRAAQSRKTTFMMVAVVVTFVLSEAPQGIYNALIALDEMRYQPCYLKAGPLLDLIIVVNSSCNFILYCSMSEQFRRNFRSVILGRSQPSNPNSTVQECMNL